MSDSVNPLWDDYILWASVPAGARGAISSDEQWARSKGYSDARQLRRWKKNPLFLARQRELLGERDVEVSVPTTEGDESDYQLVKSQLLDSAKKGNLKAMELFMKLYGRSWIEEEAAARSSDFTGMDFEQLVAEGLVAVSPEVIAGHLRAAGWTVVRGEPDAVVARV
jgi:hypothetical protein